MVKAIRGFLCVWCWTLFVLGLHGVSKAQDDNFTMLNGINSKQAGFPRAYAARRLVKNSSWQGALVYRDSEDLDISLAANWRSLELQVVAAGTARDKRNTVLPDTELDAYIEAIRRRLGVSPPPQWTQRLKSVNFTSGSGFTVLPRQGFVADDIPDDSPEPSELTATLRKTDGQWLVMDSPVSGQNHVSVRTDRPIVSPYAIVVSDETTNLLDSLSRRPPSYHLPYLVRTSDGRGALLAYDSAHFTLVIESLFQKQSNEKWTREIELPLRIVGKGGLGVEIYGTLANAKLYAFVLCYSSIGIIVLDETTGNIQNLFWSQGPSD
jgi:hypothetical protein